MINQNFHSSQLPPFDYSLSNETQGFGVNKTRDTLKLTEIQSCDILSATTGLSSILENSTYCDEFVKGEPSDQGIYKKDDVIIEEREDNLDLPQPLPTVLGLPAADIENQIPSSTTLATLIANLDAVDLSLRGTFLEEKNNDVVHQKLENRNDSNISPIVTGYMKTNIDVCDDENQILKATALQVKDNKAERRR